MNELTKNKSQSIFLFLFMIYLFPKICFILYIEITFNIRIAELFCQLLKASVKMAALALLVLKNYMYGVVNSEHTQFFCLFFGFDFIFLYEINALS